MYNLDRQGSFWLPCVSTATPRWGDWKDHEVVKTTKWSFPLVPVQLDSGVNWKASNRLIVQPQAHFPLLGECCLSLASEGACLFNRLTMAAGCGLFLVKNPFIDDWLESWKRVCSSWHVKKWRWSDLICCSTATIHLSYAGEFPIYLVYKSFCSCP